MKKLNFVWTLFICMSEVVHADIYIFVNQSNTYGPYRDMPSTFGEPIPYDGIEGRLVYANPPDACTPIQPPPNKSNFIKYIVLIARYNCTFDVKVRMAQSANYSGAIVHNVDSDALEPMSVNNRTGIYIPSVFISETDGKFFKQLIRDNLNFSIIINQDSPFNINTHLLLPFAVVVGICFIVMIIFMIVKCIKDRRRARRHRLPVSALNKMLLHKFVKGDPYETCAICLDDYVEGEKLRVLPCAHAYHSKCIDPWLTNNRRVCPVCKRKVLAQDEEAYPSDSDNEDDTTPLISPSQNQPAGGGTFNVTASGNEESGRQNLLARHDLARLLNYIRQHQILGADYPSINGESSVETSTGSSASGENPFNNGTGDHSRPSGSMEEVHVHTRPDSAGSHDDSYEVTF